MPDKKTRGGMTRVVGYLDPEGKKELEEFLKQERAGTSDKIRRALREYIRRRRVDVETDR